MQDKLQSGQSKGVGVRWPWLLALHSGAGERGRLGPVASFSLQTGSVVLFLPSQPGSGALWCSQGIAESPGELGFSTVSSLTPCPSAEPSRQALRGPDLHTCCDGEVTLTLIHSDR